MLHTPSDLHCSQPLIHAAERLREKAAALLAQSRALVARGKARAEVRARASLTYEKTDDRPLIAPAPWHAAPSAHPRTDFWAHGEVRWYGQPRNTVGP
jgi:hypothetical protein